MAQGALPDIVESLAKRKTPKLNPTQLAADCLTGGFGGAKNGMRAANNAAKKPSSARKMQREVEKGQAPRDVEMVHPPHNRDARGQEPHVHFCDGTSCNQSGSTHDAHKGTPKPSRSDKGVGNHLCVAVTASSKPKRMLDAAGRLRSVINPLGQKTVYTPDALDRITHLTDAINGVTQFGYDANSNLLTVPDAKGQQTVYTPNNMNRTESRKDPMLQIEGYIYDNNGNLTQLTGYTYDALNRRTKATFHDSTSTNYTYDAGDRIRVIEEKNASNVITATITRDYDGLDRLTQEVTAQGTVNYTYDNASRRATMTVVGQTQIIYAFDNANLVVSLGSGFGILILEEF